MCEKKYVFGEKAGFTEGSKEKNGKIALTGSGTADAAKRRTRQRVSRDHRVCCWLREAR